MRLSCISAVSLLAVVFSTLSGGDCAHAELEEIKVAQDSPHSSSKEESNLKKSPRAKHIEPASEGMPRNSGKVMKVDDAPLQVTEGPEVLRMDKEIFNRLDAVTKKELTKDLSAGEWNELLENFWVEGEDNAAILFYTLHYDKERRLKMVEQALKESLGCLFVTLSDPAYVPRTSKVIRLLELGLEVYPNLRSWILSTMYQLEYPSTKWHLENVGEDFGFLKELIETGSIRREAIVGHLADIVTLYPVEIVDSMLEKNIITKDDVCTIELYGKVWDRSGTEYLKWAQKRCGLEPDQGHIDAAVSGGHEHLVDFVADELGMKMLPSQKAVNEAAANGMLALLVDRCPGWGLFPNLEGANGAARNGRLEVLMWLVKLQPKEHIVYPNKYGANWAAVKGHIEVLEWQASLELEKQRAYPDQEGANLAAFYGRLEVLKWMAAKRGVYPSQQGADWAATNGHLDVLEWLARIEPERQRVYPGQDGADWAAKNGHLKVLKWLAAECAVYPGQYVAEWAAGSGQLKVLKWLAAKRRVYPDQGGANEAARNGHLEVLKWMAALEPEERTVYPNQDGANGAAINGNLEVLKWLAAERDVYPAPGAANLAAEGGHLEVLKWLAAERTFYPDQDGANGAAMNGHIEVLKWLAAKRRVYPDQGGANEAARNGHLEMLKWMAALEPEERTVYPNQDGANGAAINGNLEVLKWLAAEREVYPAPDTADFVAEGGNLEVLKWLAAECKVYPSPQGIYWAQNNGHIKVLKWLAAERRIVYRDQKGAGSAAGNGQLQVPGWHEWRRVYLSIERHMQSIKRLIRVSR